jgi:hypothetical protein
MLACRLCRRALNAPDGCGVCNPFKANLVSTEENAEEYPALSDVGSETVAALQTILKRHRATMKSPADSEAAEAAEAGIIQVSNTLAKVLESARKLQTDGLAAVRNMSFQERNELFAGWYIALPPVYKVKVRSGMDALDAQMNQPLLPEKTE